MVLVPFSVFFYLRSFYEVEDPDRDLWPPIGAILATNVLIGCIVIWKYAEDFKSVFVDGTGDVPYDPAQRQVVKELRRRVAKADAEELKKIK